MTSGRIGVVVATQNRGKLAEFRSALGDLPVDLLSVDEVLPEYAGVVEDGATFEENALKKARAVAQSSLMIALADDSGLEVDALGGAPGVRSARYAGERATDAENNALLLRALEDVSDDVRTARFRCALCLLDPWAPGGEAIISVSGTCEGSIARSPRGTGGFGYDPLFIVAGDGRTHAELTDEEKNAISHRGRAAQALRPRLIELIEERARTTERISFAP